jgi:hypothetical protein
MRGHFTRIGRIDALPTRFRNEVQIKQSEMYLWLQRMSIDEAASNATSAVFSGDKSQKTFVREVEEIFDVNFSLTDSTVVALSAFLLDNRCPMCQCHAS